MKELTYEFRSFGGSKAKLDKKTHHELEHVFTKIDTNFFFVGGDIQSDIKMDILPAWWALPMNLGS